MKANTHIANSTIKVGAAILLCTLAAVTVACSSHSKPAGSSTATSSVSMPGNVHVSPAALQTSVPVVEQAVETKKTTKAPKPSAAMPIVYKSRDYGVSFVYPWQYSLVSARAVANDEWLRPKADGHDGQFTLARIEIPKGFYADTNYESGYFMFSLNPDLNQQECESALTAGSDGKLETETINGVQFRRVETDEGGHGRATKLRQYVAYTNATCYELELGVKTSNESGLSREVNPDQVLRRLEGILRTVKIVPQAEKSAPAVAESPKAEPAAVSQ